MPSKEKMSHTMRIDLIPDVPSEPVVGKKKRVEIATPDPAASVPTPSAPPQPSTLEPPVVTLPTPAGDDSRYQELLQSVYDAAVIADLSGKIVDVNVRAVEFLFYPAEQLCTMTVFEVISGSDGPLIQTLCENLQNEQFTVIEAYCVRQDGSFFPAEIAVNKLQLGEMHLCFFIRDTSARRAREEMLRTEHNAIQNSGNGIAIADLEAKLEFANAAAARMWGFTNPNELLGVDVRDLLTDRDVAEQMIGIVMGERRTWMGETSAKANGKGEFYVQVSAACNVNSDGEAIGMVFSFTDISYRKRLEAAEREAERHRVMLESLGAACHHLGQPATVLLANLGIMSKRVNKEDELITELMQTSIEAAETLGQILHKLNRVNEYKTTHYLEKTDDADSPENRILEI